MPATSISVVIPTYNYANLLLRSIDSVISQRTEDIELIVVDDGSTDETGRILSELVAKFPWIVVIFQQNAGAASARNAGIRVARGRHVLLLDADDELLPDALARLKQAQSSAPDAGLIIGGAISVYPQGEERRRAASKLPRVERTELVKRYLLEKQISISHSRSMFLRRLLLQRPYPVHLRSREDVPVFAYLLANAEVVTVDVPLAKIHKHAGSLRHRADNEEEVAMAVADEVFRMLPDACKKWKKRYQAQQYLSLFRSAQERGDRDLALCYYANAVRLSVHQTLQWSYLRKLTRLLFAGK